MATIVTQTNPVSLDKASQYGMLQPNWYAANRFV
jgi:hypothetical protein